MVQSSTLTVFNFPKRLGLKKLKKDSIRLKISQRMLVKRTGSLKMKLNVTPMNPLVAVTVMNLMSPMISSLIHKISQARKKRSASLQSC
jgi:hypothetical protein